MDQQTANDYAEFLEKVSRTGFAVTVEVNGSRRLQYVTRVKKALMSKRGLERSVSDAGVDAEIATAVAHVNECYNQCWINSGEPDDNYKGIDLALHIPLNDERLIRNSFWRALYHQSPSEKNKLVMQTALGLNSGFRLEGLMCGHSSDVKQLFDTQTDYESWKTDIIGLVAEYFIFQALRDGIKGVSGKEKALLHRIPIFRKGYKDVGRAVETDTDADVIVVCPKDRFFESLWNKCEEFGWKDRYYNQRLL